MTYAPIARSGRSTGGGLRRAVRRRGPPPRRRRDLRGRGGARHRAARPVAYRVRSFLVTEHGLRALEPAVAAVDAPVYLATQEVMEAITGFHFHRGALASADRGVGRRRRRGGRRRRPPAAGGGRQRQREPGRPVPQRGRLRRRRRPPRPHHRRPPLPPVGPGLVRATSCASPSPACHDWPQPAIATPPGRGLRGGRPHPVSVGRRRPHAWLRASGGRCWWAPRAPACRQRPWPPPTAGYGSPWRQASIP